LFVRYRHSKPFFGPDDDLTWREENPDLTFCFQRIILQWTPCFFLYVFSTYEAYRIMTSRYRDIPWNWFNIARMGFTFALMVMSWVDLGVVVQNLDEPEVFDVQILVAIFNALAYILAMTLYFFYRKYGVRSTGTMFIFWFLKAFFGIIQMRTEAQLHEVRGSGTGDFAEFQFVSFTIQYTFTCIVLLLELFPDREPRYSEFAKLKNPNPELRTSFFSRLFYLYFDSYAWRGFRKPLTDDDMYDLNPEDTSRELVPPFDKYWFESVEKGRQKQIKTDKKAGKAGLVYKPNAATNGSVLPAMVKAYGGPFWFAGMLQFAISGLQFASPYLMQEIMAVIALDGPFWKGMIITLGLFLTSLLIALFNGQYFHRTFLVGFRIRTGLVSAIYRKAMRISSFAKKDTTVGEIVNLMAVDAQRFFELTSYLHVLWSAPLIIALCIYLLYELLGAAVFAGLGVMVVMIPITGFIATRMRDLQVEQMQIKDERVKKMNEILSGIKVLKLYAWEPSFQDTVVTVRNEELDVLKRAAYYGAGTYFVWTMAPFLVTLASFAVFVMADEENVLDPQTAFVALALFNILRFPLAMFPMMITFAMQAWVSIKRIDKFMNSEELDPNNVTHHKSDNAIEVKDGTFSWGDDAPTLKNVNITLRRGKLSAVVGGVGTGKSSLISALLGEMEKMKGSVNTDGSIALSVVVGWFKRTTMTFEKFCGSPFWDDKIVWDENNPDLTFCFQRVILQWVPCVFLFVFSMYDIYKITESKYRDIPWNWYNLSKMLVIFLLMCMCWIDLGMVLSYQDEQGLFDVQILTAVFNALAYIDLLVLLFFMRKYGIRTSGTMFMFWFLRMFFGIIQLRTEVMVNDERPNPIGSGDTVDFWEYQFVSYVIQYSLICLVLVMELFPDKAPMVSKYPTANKPSPELRSSFFGKLLFLHFDSFAWKGFRKPLTMDDMYDINPQDASRELVPPFDKYWKASVERGRKQQMVANRKAGKPTIECKPHAPSNGSVLYAMIRAYGGPFWFAGMLQLAISGLQFASPYLMQELMALIALDGPLWKGLLLTFGLFGASLLLGLFNGQYLYNTFLSGFRIRTGLISAIYRKAMRISSSAKKDTTVGEIVNLMAVDAQKFFELTSYLHILWSALLIIGLCVYLLYDILGAAVFAGLGVMVLIMPLSGVVAAKLRSCQVAQMKLKDDRVKKMNEILGGIKVLKLYAWEPSFQTSILDVRSEEMGILKRMAYYGAGIYFTFTIAPFLVTLVSFAVYVLMDENNILDPQTAFVSLALFNIMRFPLGMFPMVVTFSMQAWVSVKRINKFLNSAELDPSNVTHEKSDEALTIKDGTFSWGEETPTLKNINLSLRKGQLSAIVGTVGTGKSSLISALLGEMEKISGVVNTDGSIAYVPQQAWIQNATLRDNILFGKPFDQKKYDNVIDCCALRPDLAMLPGGDTTEIGEKGINLSGGQKQRVALARAVYADAEVYLFDDPLSAVDAHVGKHIFEKVVGPSGMLAWIQNATLRDNILFGKPFDQKKYDNVIDCCALRPDLAMLPGGDTTEIGEKGINLSGGQKQRVALARAVYADAEVYLFDDPLSAVDAHVGKHIFEKVVGPSGMLVGKSRLLVTHGISYLPFVENIFVIKEGEISESGSYQANLIGIEESATGAVTWDVYRKYIKSIGLQFGLWSVVFSAINQGSGIFSSIWLTDWSEDPEAITDTSVRDMYLGVYGALGGVQSIALFLGSVLIALGCLKAARKSHDKLLESSMRMPMSFFDTTPLGRIINRFSKDVDVVDNVLPMTIRAWLLFLFSVVGVFVVIGISTPIFLAVVPPLMIIYYFVQRFYIDTSRQLKRLESVTRSPIYSHFGESIGGQSTIRAYGQQERFTQESERRVDYNQLVSYPTIIANRWLGIRLDLVGSLVILFAALFAVLAQDTIGQATVGLSISYALQISNVLSMLVRMTSEVETNIVAVERLEEYTDLPREAEWTKGTVDKNWPDNGQVQFKDYQIRYRDGLDLVIRGISLNVRGGEKIGIVGRTGAGKSSLTLGLFR
uniref:ABC-type glutathione-S-conjugate transporter n=1 Tax=Anopheles atroparvus TaxID=41427 RepID=A0A182J6S8_ANOAO